MGIRKDCVSQTLGPFYLWNKRRKGQHEEPSETRPLCTLGRLFLEPNTYSSTQWAGCYSSRCVWKGSLCMGMQCGLMHSQGPGWQVGGCS